MDRNEVLGDIDALVRKCDSLVDDIVIARLAKDDAKAAHVHWKMESVVVACQQELTFLRDYIGGNIPKNA